MAKKTDGDTLTYVASISFSDPAFLQFEEDYARRYDELWEEHKKKEREAEKRLRGFVIT